MGLGHVPKEPIRAQGEGAHVQRRQRRGTPQDRPVDLDAAKPKPKPPDLRNQARGRWGEQQAARWYIEHGDEVVERNWRCSRGEIDLIVRRDDVLIFVEVKARVDDRFGSAASAVDLRKQHRIRLVAARFLAEHPEHRGEIRFDVVAVTGVHVEVIEAAF